MPLFENICSRCYTRFEWYSSTRDKPDPQCRKCKSPTRRLISGFAAIWTRSISEYGDPRKESYAKDIKRGGHWEYRKRSHGATPDKPIPVFLDSVQKQREFCREEGLYNPSDVGDLHVQGDGKTVTSNAGMPGSWS